ncbi:cytochrome-c oxidase, cbb3-type subunit II [Roseospirillum parvum]|uniref:Cytochrome c oxidase cbb3-type subunit 2 n=1 Tax=Roseospirillum parvum TaxID=83401 RepID=A0A1G7WP71_9PROT|nr:cytochrome-c oxidase, cbb3-type subunit II [Roseospirillum parvum]SDG73713.1 cytochrome c oxidase cbb3-type subunit 2 [Roseospirillum parvum]
MSLIKHHAKIETNVLLLTVGILLTVIAGGLVEIVPLFTIKSTIERVEGVRPYSPLELAGRNIYLREGCYNCHSQMIRPFRDEVERYGHYSLAAESIYDHPFQWGSKRTGPDLARVGGKYSDEWHARHLIDPRSVVAESIMPGYPHLARRDLAFDDAADHLKTLRVVGVPYSDAQIAQAGEHLAAQADPWGDHDALTEAYPGAKVGDFDGDPERLTEMDALIAYLQVLGTMVDFSDFDPARAGALR